MNVWKTVIEYCNMYAGQIGSRQGLIYHVNRVAGHYGLNQGFNTVDCYKNYLIQAGLIHKIRSNGRTLQGKFFIPKKIDESITIKEVREKAYGPKLMIMGTDHADPLGQRSSKSMCLTAGCYYIGGTNGGEYQIMDNTANAPPEPKEPEFLSKDEMKI